MRRLLFCATAWAGLGMIATQGFVNAPLGSIIQNVEMPTLRGGPHHLLGEAEANVFVFFKPGLDYSNAFLKQLAACHKEMAGQPVHWVAIVSDRIARPMVEAEVRETGLEMPVLIDEGDAFFGRLGVTLYPVVGITDRQHRLVAYEPFRKIHYLAVIRARIRHLLKEISDQELETVLNPPLAIQGGDTASARRRLKLAEKLYQAQRHQKALENAQRSIELDPNRAEAHALLGRILAAQGKRAAAAAAFQRALQLDPDNAPAREGLKTLPSLGAK